MQHAEYCHCLECRVRRGVEADRAHAALMKEVTLNKTQVIQIMRQRAGVLRANVKDSYSGESQRLMRREASTWERAAQLVEQMEDGDGNRPTPTT